MRELLLPGLMIALAIFASACVAPGPVTPDLNCTSDSDCVLAARLDTCCDCPRIYSRGQVENDPRLILFQYEGNSSYPLPVRDYPYPVPRVAKANCEEILCKTCAEPPSSLACLNKTCKSAETS